MKKIVLFILLSGLVATSCFAKRVPPPEVEPITVNGCVYSSHLVGSFCSSTAVVYVTSEENGKQIKTVEIYRNIYNIFMETDVQDVWINKMELIDSNTIRITNEGNEVYELDLKTYKVKKVVL